MSSRMLAALVASWLPTLGVILPLGPAYRMNALVVGTLVTVLTGLSIVDNRARYAAAALAAWTAFMPFFGNATIVDLVLNVSWGGLMVPWLIGPFSESPAVTFVRPITTRVPVPAPALDVRAAA
jgi:hypothetical protein